VVDMERSVRGKPEGKAERLEVDRAAMLSLPAESSTHAGSPASANSLSLVRFDRNDYSVPTDFAHHEVTVLGGTEDVRILSGTKWWPDTEVLVQRGDLLRSPALPALFGTQARGIATPVPGGLGPACMLRALASTPRADLGSGRHQGVHQGAAPHGAGVTAPASPEPSRRR